MLLGISIQSLGNFVTKDVVIFPHHILWSFFWCMVFSHIILLFQKLIWAGASEGTSATCGRTHLVILKCIWPLKFYLAVFLLYIKVWKKKESIIKNNNVTIWKHSLDTQCSEAHHVVPAHSLRIANFASVDTFLTWKRADINNYTFAMSFCNVNKGFAGLDTNRS